MNKNMLVSIKSFEELSSSELYDLLQLRAEVFVVEQDCPYLDVDGKDNKAIHVLGYKNALLVAYTRLFKPGDYFQNASIGRVVVRQNQRKFGYGKVIMQKSIEALQSEWDAEIIEISAQTYLTKFYNDLGFVQTGEEYLEDDIPHIRMIRNKKT